MLLSRLPSVRGSGLARVRVQLSMRQTLSLLPRRVGRATVLFFFRKLGRGRVSSLLRVGLSLMGCHISGTGRLLSGRLRRKES